MKALLVIAGEAISGAAAYFLKPMGFEIIHYRNPLKALDNLEEVEPQAVVVSAEDFPRHWKPLVQVLREKRSKEECVFLLLKGRRFSFEEAAKAVFLGVNGVIGEDFSDRSELDRFRQLIRRYFPVDELRADERFIPSPYDRLDFTFAHPERWTIITGRIESISTMGLGFRPDSPDALSDLSAGTALPDCSLRVGESIQSFSCTLARVGQVLGIEFEAGRDDLKALISDYLVSYADRSHPEEDPTAVKPEGLN